MGQISRKEYIDMKKIVAIILALTLVLALAACGGRTQGVTEPTGTEDTKSNDTEGTKPTETEDTEPTETEATEPTETDGTEPTETEPPETKPADTQPPETKPQATEPPATNPPATEPPVTNPPAMEPPATEPPATDPPTTEPSESHPPIGPGFQLGPGGIITPGGNGGGETQDVPVTDAGDLVDRLAAICEGKTGEMMVDNHSLSSSGMFSNWFGGMAYTEGTKVAVNAPMMGSIAHVILLIEPAEGVDAGEYAKELERNANPRWQICVSADTVKYAVKDGLILFIMTNSEIVNADDVISAFKG